MCAVLSIPFNPLLAVAQSADCLSVNGHVQEINLKSSDSQTTYNLNKMIFKSL